LSLIFDVSPAFLLPQLGAACSSHAHASWFQWQPPLAHAMLQHLSKQRSSIKQYHAAFIVKDIAQLGFLCLQPHAAAEASEAAAAAAVDAAAALVNVNGAAAAAECANTAAVDGAGANTGEAVAALLGGALPAAASNTANRAYTAAGNTAAKAAAAAAAVGVVSSTKGVASDLAAAQNEMEGVCATAGSSCDADVATGLDRSTKQSSGRRFATARVINTVQHDAKAVTLRAAVTSAASNAYLAHIYPQLQHMGLYEFYCELCSMYPGGVTFKFTPAGAAASQQGQERAAKLLQPPPQHQQQQQQHSRQAEQQQQQQQQRHDAWQVAPENLQTESGSSRVPSRVATADSRSRWRTANGSSSSSFGVGGSVYAKQHGSYMGSGSSSIYTASFRSTGRGNSSSSSSSSSWRVNSMRSSMGIISGPDYSSIHCYPSLMSPRGGPSQRMQEQQRAASPASVQQGSSSSSSSSSSGSRVEGGPTQSPAGCFRWHIHSFLSASHHAFLVPHAGSGTQLCTHWLEPW
jgi:hypothetical protein